MTYALPLPDRLSNEGWRVKIRNRERVEPPHVTIMRKVKIWRYALREPGFLDREPPPRKVSEQVLEVIHENFDRLKREWNRKYPRNPISSIEGESNEAE